MASSLQQPQILLKPFADSGDKNTIPEEATGDKNTIPEEATGTQQASLDEGFPEITELPILQGGIPPERKDFNALGYLTTSQYFFLQNGGKFTFNQDVSDAIGGYAANAILEYVDPNTHIAYQVISLINNNTYNFVLNPSYIDGVKWAKAYDNNNIQLVNSVPTPFIPGTLYCIPES